MGRLLLTVFPIRALAGSENAGENVKVASFDGSKRLRTYYVVRQRYKRARWIAAAVGALVVAVLIAEAFTRLQTAGLPPDKGFYTGAIALLLAGTVVSWLVVEGLWRWARRRHFWEWQ
jgi:hypothetical protein